jgi:hypothetical protein
MNVLADVLVDNKDLKKQLMDEAGALATLEVCLGCEGGGYLWPVGGDWRCVVLGDTVWV